MVDSTVFEAELKVTPHLRTSSKLRVYSLNRRERLLLKGLQLHLKTH